MPRNNESRPLTFDGRLIKAELVENLRDYSATGVITNLSNEAMIIDGEVPGVIPPWKSTILRNGRVRQARRASIIDVLDTTNLGGLVLDNWFWLGDARPDFSRTIPLYISPVDVAGEVDINPWKLSNHPQPRDEIARYDIRLNLWWAPARTDAGIHRVHDFIELHTQIYGQGRIQIFEDEAGKRLYRDISAAPGDTHDPIVEVVETDDFRYPWHRGWTDEDCIWMAIELHPKKR